MERETLLKKLTELDFMTTDICLYLNTHPLDKDAISQYNKIIRAAETVRGKYEKLAGPICSFRSLNRCEDVWQWNDDPWPWESAFNFEAKKEACK